MQCRRQLKIKDVSIASLLDEERVVVIEDAVSKAQVIRLLIERVGRTVEHFDVEQVVRLVGEREDRGSTFLNEGVALPHARIPGLLTPVAALAITHAGVLDAKTDRPVKAVFLLLTPAADGSHLAALAAVGRLFTDRTIQLQLSAAFSPEAVMRIVCSGR